MYLKKAIEIVNNDLLEDKSVSKSQVRNWMHLEVLPKAIDREKVDPKGWRGVYPEDLPSRIATVADLKDYYETKEIAGIVDWLEPLIEEYESIDELIDSDELENVATEKLQIDKENLFEGFIKDRKKRRKAEVLWDYINIRKIHNEKMGLIEEYEEVKSGEV